MFVVYVDMVFYWLARQLSQVRILPSDPTRRQGSLTNALYNLRKESGTSWNLSIGNSVIVNLTAVDDNLLVNCSIQSFPSNAHTKKKMHFVQFGNSYFLQF